MSTKCQQQDLEGVFQVGNTASKVATEFISAVISAIFQMGIGGGHSECRLQPFKVSIDFGDNRPFEGKDFVDNAELLDRVNDGLALANQIVATAGDTTSDLKLKDVVNNEADVVIGMAVAAKLVQQPNWSPTHPLTVAAGTTKAVAG